MNFAGGAKTKEKGRVLLSRTKKTGRALWSVFFVWKRAAARNPPMPPAGIFCQSDF